VREREGKKKEKEGRREAEKQREGEGLQRRGFERARDRVGARTRAHEAYQEIFVFFLSREVQ
jgi:hypothetical protein